MSYIVIIILCLIVILSYLFEITGKYTKIPSVVLLMILGLFMRHLSSILNTKIPDLSFLLPIMGTLGLILIVLEGSLDLTINSKKKGIMIWSFVSATLLFILIVGIFSSILFGYYDFTIKTAILNSIPLGIISSAVAIPSSNNLGVTDKEFIVYESSLSDIIGIIAFDFVLFNQSSIYRGAITFSFEIISTIILSGILSLILAYMLHKIGHHVKYIIILTVVILVYTFAKLIHWPSLIVVLIFGLMMNNNHLFQFNILKKHMDFNELDKNLIGFRQITGELTFIIRAFFFLIFGFYTPINELFSLTNLANALVICFVIFSLRGLMFKFVLRKPLTPLFYFAPRGLITILLFLSMPEILRVPFNSEGLITQVIFISILFMAFGNIISMSFKRKLT